MLTRSKQIKYFVINTTSALTYLNRFRKSEKAEDLHKFRVKIKKLKSMFQFITPHWKNDKVFHEFKQLNKFFRKSGAIRDLDVGIVLLKSFKGVNSALLLKLDQNRKQHVLKFISKIDKNKVAISKNKKKSSIHFNPIKDVFIKKIFAKKLKPIFTILLKDFSKPKKIHKARKQIKQLLYFSELVPKSVALKLNINTKDLNKIQGKIGEWHDTFNVKSLLTTLRYDAPDLLNRINKDELRLEKQLKILTKRLIIKIK